MILFALTVLLIANITSVLLDFLMVLLAIRVLTSWKPIPVLMRFDRAGEPLLAGAQSGLRRAWRRVFPGYPLRDDWLRLVFVLVLIVGRMIISAVLPLLSICVATT